jgi:hypothetical protein
MRSSPRCSRGHWRCCSSRCSTKQPQHNTTAFLAKSAGQDYRPLELDPPMAWAKSFVSRVASIMCGKNIDCLIARPPSVAVTDAASFVRLSVV